jgi:hypothetical protein
LLQALASTTSTSSEDTTAVPPFVTNSNETKETFHSVESSTPILPATGTLVEPCKHVHYGK